MMMDNRPALHTILSPSLLYQQELSNAVVVIIDVLRATSTIATALFNGARYIIPVDSVQKCIDTGVETGAITAGEREGKVADGLQHGNSPFEYSRDFISGKILVLTTTNGTKLLHAAADSGATTIVTGSFPNLSAVSRFVIEQNKNVILACAGWKNRINLEDTLFAGAVIDKVKAHFDINCDSSTMAHTLYKEGAADLYDFIKRKGASHYTRLSGYGLEKDIRYCLTPDTANVLPLYKDGKLWAV